MHEPDVKCISKGKDHKKYEFGSKVSITVARNSGVIIGALNIPGYDYDVPRSVPPNPSIKVLALTREQNEKKASQEEPL